MAILASNVLLESASYAAGIREGLRRAREIAQGWDSVDCNCSPGIMGEIDDTIEALPPIVPLPAARGGEG